jgi:hypothetical protein
MRLTVFAAAVGSVLALAGFAGAANASATIDLIWASLGAGSLPDRILGYRTLPKMHLQLPFLKPEVPRRSPKFGTRARGKGFAP